MVNLEDFENKRVREATDKMRMAKILKTMRESPETLETGDILFAYFFKQLIESKDDLDMVQQKYRELIAIQNKGTVVHNPYNTLNLLYPLINFDEILQRLQRR